MFFLILSLFLVILVNLIVAGFVEEPFVNNAKDTSSIVLLGDSTLKNDSYVKSGLSVSESLSSRTTTHCYALNDSLIVDIYSQIEQIPNDYNNKNTNIFLSVGGNNILKTFSNQQGFDKKSLNPMFLAYKKLVQAIQAKMYKSKLYLVNLYYPQSLKYFQYKPILEEWNKLVDDFAYDSINKISGVVRLNEELTKKSDFTFGIEPSDTGGVKIADAIIKLLANNN